MEFPDQYDTSTALGDLRRISTILAEFEDDDEAQGMAADLNQAVAWFGRETTIQDFFAETTVQDLQFQLMRKASFNNFDGDLVVDSLLEHRDLWEGVVMDRADYYYSAGGERKENHNEPVDLIKLRDIGEGYWNVDTVYILAADEKEDALELLVRREWGADEVDWYQNTHVGRYLRVWFD